MQSEPQYANVVADVAAFLRGRVADLANAGIDLCRTAIDPGFGFGKSVEHNFALLRRLPALQAIGRPVLVGLSRKSMLGAVTGRTVNERVAASVAAAVLAVERGRAYRSSTRCRGNPRCAAGVGSDGDKGGSMTRKYFGTDGVRGTVGEDPITPEFVLRLGQAAGRVLARQAEGRAGARQCSSARTRASRGTCWKPRSKQASPARGWMSCFRVRYRHRPWPT